jgi:hypothetical protein
MDYSDTEEFDDIIDDDIIDDGQAVVVENIIAAVKRDAITVDGGDDDDDVDEEDKVDDDAGELVDSARSEKTDNVSKVFRRIIRVPDAERRTSNYMSKFEVTEAISIRTQQIDNGSPHFCSAADIIGIYDARKIAEIEFLKGRSPLLLRRKIGERVQVDDPVGEGKDRGEGKDQSLPAGHIICEYYEYWNISKEMKYGTLATLE